MRCFIFNHCWHIILAEYDEYTIANCYNKFNHKKLKANKQCCKCCKKGIRCDDWCC